MTNAHPAYSSKTALMTNNAHFKRFEQDDSRFAGSARHCLNQRMDRLMAWRSQSAEAIQFFSRSALV